MSTTFATPEPERPGMTFIRNTARQPEGLCSMQEFGKPGVEVDDESPTTSTAGSRTDSEDERFVSRGVGDDDATGLLVRAVERLEEIAALLAELPRVVVELQRDARRDEKNANVTTIANLDIEAVDARIAELRREQAQAGYDVVAARAKRVRLLAGAVDELGHEDSLAGHGADPTAPATTGEAATSPVGDTVRDATDTISSPPPAGRAE